MFLFDRPQILQNGAINNNKPGQFIKRHKWWFGPSHLGHFDILTMMGRECSRLDPSYQRHITFACTGCYQLHSLTVWASLPRFIASANLLTPKGWIAWLAKVVCMHKVITQLNPMAPEGNEPRLSDPWPTRYNEPTAAYIIDYIHSC